MINISFLFPCDHFNEKNSDEMFQEQVNFLQKLGFKCHFVNITEISSIIKLQFDLTDEVIIYRGWMLTENEYKKLESLVNIANGHMLISFKKYSLAHYLPNWYSYIEGLTAKTKILGFDDNLQNELATVKWDKVFIKDFVKSLKISIGSIIDDINLLPVVIKEMKKYRGNIEGGICIREFEEYVVETEIRYFSINGIPYGPSESEPIPSIVYDCCNRLPHPFFSLDVIQKIDNQYRIVEIGDGQVSDYVGWELNRFIDVICKLSQC